MEQAVVKTFENLPEAELARNLLAEEKLWSMTRGGALSGYQGGGGLTSLIVKAQDVDRARLILGIEL